MSLSVGAGGHRIVLKLIGDGAEMWFRVNMTTQLGKLMKIFSRRVGIPDLRFLFDGHRICDDATPEQMKMEHEDVIEVFQKLSGPDANDNSFFQL